MRCIIDCVVASTRVRIYELYISDHIDREKTRHINISLHVFKRERRNVWCPDVVPHKSIPE